MVLPKIQWPTGLYSLSFLFLLHLQPPVFWVVDISLSQFSIFAVAVMHMKVASPYSDSFKSSIAFQFDVYHVFQMLLQNVFRHIIYQ